MLRTLRVGSRFLRGASSAGILCVLVLGGLTFLGGAYPAALIQRAWVRFVTVPEPIGPGDTVLAVAFDRQDHALSCEAAALKMALAYHGVSVDESALISAIGSDPTLKSQGAQGTVWGDPHRAFVGNIDGRMLVDGYGVYWEPVASAAAAYRRVQIIEGGTPAEVARAIADGDPVLVWGFLGSGRRFSWTTPGGARIPAVLQEHVYVAYGFRGPSDSPLGFFLMDPIYGSRYQPTDEFRRVWSALGDSGIIIR